MRLPTPLFRGRLVRRYKRFLADVDLDTGDRVTAHVANPGSMLTLKDPGLPVYLSHNENPKRKLRYSWELAEPEGVLVGIDSGRANRIAEEALRQGWIAPLAGYPELRREVRYGDGSRVDFLLQGDGAPPCYVEVKNVHWRRGAMALFPDAVTARGTRHLQALAAERSGGARAVVLFVVQRADCEALGLAEDVDPAFVRAFQAAREAGVESYGYASEVGLDTITLSHPLPFA